MKLISYLQKDAIYLIVIILSFLSILRYLIVPLSADEITYFKLAGSLLEGSYYLNDQPSTVTPIIPLILSIFRALFGVKIGVILVKLFFLILTFFGFRFIYYFLKQQQLEIPIIASLIILTLVNTNSIAWYMRLYPEAILFFCFWGFLYYFNKEVSIRNFQKLFLLFLILALTRYLYIVLGILVLVYYYHCLQQKTSTNINFPKILLYTIIFLIPIFLWFRYVYITEQNQTIGISYFNRFKSDNIFIYNIKCGLGLLQHHEVSNINGIPAFISLFVPITGLRNFPMSIILILLFIFGYILKKKKESGISALFVAIIIIMSGLIFAGTGFSRYWLILLPGFYLGYYYTYKFFKLKDKWFVILAKIIAVLYIFNELRLDYMIIEKYI